MLPVSRGSVVRARVKIRLVDGSVPTADPTTVVVRVTDPSSPTPTDYTLAAAQVVKDTTVNPYGDYYYDISTAGLADSKLGRWVVAGMSTGTPTTSDTKVFLLQNETTE